MYFAQYFLALVDVCENILDKLDCHDLAGRLALPLHNLSERTASEYLHYFVLIQDMLPDDRQIELFIMIILLK